MSDPVGRPQAIKDRLKYYVDDALGGSVSNNWRINIMLLPSFPISTIRYDDVTLNNMNYGRKTPDDGKWAEYRFTVHVHQTITTSVPVTNPIGYKTMDLAEELVDYLIDIRGDSTERSTYKIQWIDQLRTREVSPKGNPRNVYTVAVSGTMYVQWVDI